MTRFGLLIALFVLAATAPGAAAEDEPRPDAPAASPGPPRFAEDTLTYVYGPDHRNPFVVTPSQPDGASIARQHLELKHVDAWKYGHDFVEIVLKKSDEAEPAAGGGAGAMGFYSVFRFGAGLNRIAGRPLVAKGPLRDVDLQVGLNLEAKNVDFAPNERTLYAGANLQFAAGRGFVNVGLHLRKEWNHNGHLGVGETYDLGFNVEPVWHVPFRIGGVRLAFDGFADYNTAKGKDAAGRETRPELIARPLLKVDVSPLVGRGSRALELALGLQYWHNIFGKDASRAPGASELTPVFGLTVHLPLGAGGH